MNSNTTWSEQQINNQIVKSTIVNDYNTDIYWLHETSDERIRYSYPMSPIEKTVVQRRINFLNRKRKFNRMMQNDIYHYYKSSRSFCKCFIYYFLYNIPNNIYNKELEIVTGVINANSDSELLLDKLKYLLYYADYLKVPYNQLVLETYNKFSDEPFMSFDKEYESIKDLTIMEQMDNLSYWTDIREKAIAALNNEHLNK